MPKSYGVLLPLQMLQSLLGKMAAVLLSLQGMHFIPDCTVLLREIISEV